MKNQNDHPFPTEMQVSSTIQLTQKKKEEPLIYLSPKKLKKHRESIEIEGILEETDKDHESSQDHHGKRAEEIIDEEMLEVESSILKNNSSVRKKSAKYKLSDSECPLCLDSQIDEEFVSFTRCEHKYCLKCAMKQIKEILCPTKGCGALLDNKSFILSYLTEDELQKLKSIPNEPNENEQQIVPLDQAQPSIQQQPQKREQKKQLSQIVNEPEKMASSMSNSQYKNPKGTDLSISNQFMEKSLTMRKSRSQQDTGEAEREKQAKEPLFPKKVFQSLCTEIWSNKWSKFLKMLPISIIILVLLLVVLTLWLVWVIIYFAIVWIILIPIIWAVYEIWGCFGRNITNIYLRTFVFILSLLGFPLLFAFFYLLTLGVIFWRTLFKPDMHQVAKGKASLVLSCGKLHLHRSEVTLSRCKCKFGEKCLFCEQKDSILCLVL